MMRSAAAVVLGWLARERVASGQNSRRHRLNSTIIEPIRISGNPIALSSYWRLGLPVIQIVEGGERTTDHVQRCMMPLKRTHGWKMSPRTTMPMRRKGPIPSQWFGASLPASLPNTALLAAGLVLMYVLMPWHALDWVPDENGTRGSEGQHQGRVACMRLSVVSSLR